VQSVSSDAVAPLHGLVEETLAAANKMMRDVVSDALKEAFAHLDRSLIDLRRSAQESVDHANTALKESLSDLDRLVERRIQAVEEGSMQRLRVGIEETVRASARPVRKELDGLLDAISRKVLALSIPLVAVLIMLRLRTVLDLSESRPALVGAAAAVVGLVTAVIGIGEIVRRFAARTRIEARAVYVDLIPFSFAAFLLVLAFCL
jgi:hypothetical protein